MPDVEKMMEPPLGSVGGPEYVRQEREAAIQVLEQRVKRAEEALEAAGQEPDWELKKAKIRAAQEMLASALSEAESVAA